MKKTLLLTLTLAATTLAFAAKIYVNPGHGGWGSNDRPMGTISYLPIVVSLSKMDISIC